MVISYAYGSTSKRHEVLSATFITEVSCYCLGMGNQIKFNRFYSITRLDYQLKIVLNDFNQFLPISGIFCNFGKKLDINFSLDKKFEFLTYFCIISFLLGHGNNIFNHLNQNEAQFYHDFYGSSALVVSIYFNRLKLIILG